MKKLNKILLILILCIAVCGCERCEEEEIGPSVQTLKVENVTMSSALVSGVVEDPGSDVITEKGICWSSDESEPDIFANKAKVNAWEEGEFTVKLKDLDPETTYYVRAYAINQFGIGYGEVLHFNYEWETIQDIDGNVYRIVTIGDQTWTMDNWKSTHYRDGSPISINEDDENWKTGGPALPMMCWYDNNREENDSLYGALYNYYAVANPLIAPEGWRVPSIEDYDQLQAFLGGYYVGGGKAKTTGPEWEAPNAGATNESHFSAMPGGGRSSGGFWDKGHNAYFMTTTLAGPGVMACIFYTEVPVFDTYMGTDFNTGFSLRLIKE
jgi:uncharacterized protein (TIGR02145 family)